jgi:hypothetical protein
MYHCLSCDDYGTRRVTFQRPLDGECSIPEWTVLNVPSIVVEFLNSPRKVVASWHAQNNSGGGVFLSG